MVSDVLGRQLTKKLRTSRFSPSQGIKFLRTRNRYMLLYLSVHIKNRRVSKNISDGSKQKKSLQRRRDDRQAEGLKGPSWLMFHPLLFRSE